jgi:hypothetical protein
MPLRFPVEQRADSIPAESPPAMDRSSAAAARIREIETRQDELLRQLEELERRSAELLARQLPIAPAAAAPVSGALASDCGPDAV